MEQSKRRDRRGKPGGILSLAKFVTEYSEAIDYDLMTRTRYTIDDIGGALSWRSLYSFIKHLGTDSALARDLDKRTGWESTVKTNALLADLYDLLQVINANLVAIGGGKPKKIKPYPRPSGDEDNTKKIGKGALPLNELKEWINNRRK